MPPLCRWMIALVSAAGLVGVGLAQVPGGRAAQFRDLFVQLDANRDGAIVREEVPPAARSAFDRLLRRGDHNHNGKLEADEYRAVLLDLREFAERTKAQAIQKFQSLDKDRDGKIARAEFPGPRARFDRLDQDADGYLSREEFLGAAPGQAAAKVKAAAKKKAEGVKKSG